MLSTTDAVGSGEITNYSYDGFDRLQTVTNPDGDNDQTSYSYDADGNMLSETDADGNQTHYTYNALNEQKSMTDALDQTTYYAYDADGNLTQTIEPNGNASGTTAASQEIDYEYDALDRETAENWISGGSMNRQISTNYYVNGLVASVTDSGDANSQYDNYSYTYDSIGRLLTVDSDYTTGNGSTTDNVILTAGYDRDGNRTSLSANIGGTVQGRYQRRHRRHGDRWHGRFREHLHVRRPE